MGIVTIVVFLIIIGAVMYLVNSVIPIVPWMKTVINVLVLILVLLWLLRIFGFAVPLIVR